MEREWMVVLGVALVAVVLGAASLERCGACNRPLLPWQGHNLGISSGPGERWEGRVCSAECAAARIKAAWTAANGAAQ